MVVALLTFVACTPAPPAQASPIVVTWNVGSGGAPEPSAGWTQELADRADRTLGNGLAWQPAIDDARAWLRASGASLVALQEVLDPATTCPDVPAEDRAGLLCETWAPGDPSVTTRLLPEGADVRCMDGAPDKCVGVVPPARFLDAGDLRGERVDGCGERSRVGAADVEFPGAGALRVVAVHGTSGLGADDQLCRVRWLDAAFALADDGPAIVLGDFNTDPLRLQGIDASAVHLAALTAGWLPLRALDAPPSYGGLVTIDHAFAHGVDGRCTVPGVDDATPASALAAFDHAPLRCTVERPP